MEYKTMVKISMNQATLTIGMIFFNVFSKKNHSQFRVNSDIIIAEILFLVVNYYVRHNLSQDALEDLLKMLNVISGTKCFPENFETFASQFRNNPYDAKRVYFCTFCQYDFGTNLPKKGTLCPICKSQGHDFFVTIPIEPQLREMVLKYSLEIEQHSMEIENKNICDINRGRVARRLMKEHPEKHLTLSSNTDGAASRKSTTKKTLYPVFVTLNNLPPVLRFNKHNLLIAALWLSKEEPNLNLLYKYFCIELRILKKGISIGNQNYTVSLLQNCVDSVARCKVLCMKQYNGDYGCTMCLHPGKATDASPIRYYPSQRYPKSDDATTRKMMDEVQFTGQEVHGILNKSVFVALPEFDIIISHPPDYMHAVLLGVMKQLWASLTESENHKAPFYVGLRMKDIEKRFLSFRPPSSFPRYPRSLNQVKKFKANEWEAMLLHYIYPSLYKILPDHLLNHIMLLSSTIFLLLDPNLSEEMINWCDKKLKLFGCQFEAIYGIGRMTYNVHLMSHLAETVRNLGALYNSSLFPYESGNGMLLKFCSGNNKPVLQIEKKYYLNKLCQNSRVPQDSVIKQWVQSIWFKKHSIVQYNPQKIFTVNNSTLFDNDVTQRHFSYHSRLYYNRLNLCTKAACSDLKYDDSWIWINSNFFRIHAILCDQANIIYILGQKLDTISLFPNMYSYTFTDEVRIMKVTDSLKQCISMKVETNGEYMRFISICKKQTQVD
ncbi:uncharacterized protein LOC131436976 [Malaya genurostris]|uniref:uncharacterized protein LOC131436976 n=1 Tax=Malaya genurostris TaxID=325434 RepID=UPI0026F3D148|nr:uncharacterized protein LOC131436976 [Malaya genurostris]